MSYPPLPESSHIPEDETDDEAEDDDESADESARVSAKEGREGEEGCKGEEDDDDDEEEEADDDAYIVFRIDGGSDILRDTASSSSGTKGEDEADEVLAAHADAEP